MTKNNISLFGLGKLGATILGCLAYKKFKVIGVDNNQEFVNKINLGISPVDETNLDQLIKENKKRIFATNSYELAIEKSNISLIVVPTPSKKNGEYELKFVMNCLSKIARLIKSKKAYHLIVLCSTVMPGDCKEKLIPNIERISQKKYGTNFGFIYSPEFISLGNIIQEYLKPNIVLIGSEKKKDTLTIMKIYKKIFFIKKFCLMNITEAELIKISINCFMTLKISFSNMIGIFCKKLGNLNSMKVLKTLSNFFENFTKGSSAGMGFGGPCLPRDNLAVFKLSKKLNSKFSLPLSIDEINNKLVNFFYKNYLKKYQNKKILFIGVSYKPLTSFYEESPAIKLIYMMKKKISVFDYNNIKFNFSNKIVIEKKLSEAVKKNDVIVLCHKDDKNNNINFKNKIVIDFWRQIRLVGNQKKLYVF